MKKIKIMFDSENINIKAKGMSERTLINVLGQAFIAACREFDYGPLSTLKYHLLDSVPDLEDDEDDFYVGGGEE